MQGRVCCAPVKSNSRSRCLVHERFNRTPYKFDYVPSSMTAISLSQLLTLYTWFVLAAVLSFLMLIARFYQKFSNARMFFRLFLMPILLFGAAAVRYASIDRVAHDPFADLLMAAGGLLLAGLSLHLYYRMMSGRHPL